jgi:hypothetical protein
LDSAQAYTISRVKTKKFYSTGTGDLDVFDLSAGNTIKDRSVPIPANLPAGTYELAAEIWPSNKIGVANDLTDATCSSLGVP